MRCVVCRKDEDGGMLGDASMCNRCYNKYVVNSQRVEQLEKQVVAMDYALETDDRLVAARKALETAMLRIRFLENELYA